MKKLVNMGVHVKSATVKDQQVLRISVPPECLRDWLLCLHLLADDLIQTCAFLNVKAATKLDILVDSRCRWVVGRRDAHFIITLDRTSLDYLRAFFGRYYRDGFAEVDHIDLQPDEPLGSYITIDVQEYAAPLSAEDTTRMLNAEFD